MEFWILGELTVRASAGAVAVGPPKQRTLLAMLLVNANTVVSLDSIIAELWNDRPPRSSVPNARTYAARIRTALPDIERSRLISRPSGYLFRLQPDELDLNRFVSRAAAGRASLDRGDAAAAVSELSAARGLWRGSFAEDVPEGASLSARKVALEERRETAEEDWCEALMALGHHASAADALRRLVAVQPLRERRWALLMRALYALQDTSAALGAFAQARSNLVESLGVEPGPDLQALHSAILRRDNALAGVRSPLRIDVRPAAAVPRQLPAAPALVGRVDELERLAGSLSRRGRDPVLISVHGQGGVGKSALAVRAAHLAAASYPDGQLFADLGGPTSLNTSRLADLLRHFLNELGGVAGPDIDPDRLGARLRSILAGRRILVVLDDVADTAQIRPFLSTGSSSAVLVTSRARFTTLDGAEHVLVRELSVPDSVELLSRLVGPRVRAEPDAAVQIVELCGCLPLALRIAAARLLDHPHWRIRELADRLSDRSTRLDELETNGLALRQCLRSAYDGLVTSADVTDRAAGTMLRMLGALAGQELDPEQVAGLTGIEAAAVVRSADRLAELHLVKASPNGRYHLPELTRLLVTDLGVVDVSA